MLLRCKTFLRYTNAHMQDEKNNTRNDDEHLLFPRHDIKRSSIYYYTRESIPFQCSFTNNGKKSRAYSWLRLKNFDVILLLSRIRAGLHFIYFAAWKPFFYQSVDISWNHSGTLHLCYDTAGRESNSFLSQICFYRLAFYRRSTCSSYKSREAKSVTLLSILAAHFAFCFFSIRIC